MHAIGHTIKKRNPAMRLSYVSAEKFTIEVINSLRFDRMISFRDRFHTVDVLLVDDIQFIAGKERTQEEFFHTFNALYEQQKQIVISSDCLPKDINSIEERLRSRFEWGLIADIQPPDLETKIAILQKKAENDRFPLPDEVAEYIARAIKSNVRELEGALTRLVAYSSLTGSVLNLATAQQVLRNIIATQEKRVTIDLIQKKVGEQFGLREQDRRVLVDRVDPVLASGNHQDRKVQLRCDLFGAVAIGQTELDAVHEATGIGGAHDIAYEVDRLRRGVRPGACHDRRERRDDHRGAAVPAGHGARPDRRPRGGRQLPGRLR